jgi:phosphatidylcholine synthase
MTASPAWAVHLLTATSAGLALLAAVAVEAHAWQLAFLWLGVALVVDGIDGPLARFVHAADRLPWMSGAVLDLVVDYCTYVFVPALILIDGPLLTPPFGLIAAIVIAMVGALYFADTRMKTVDAGFRGFPAAWNAVVFQLMVYRLPQPLTLLVLSICVVLTFMPVEFVHPLRVRRWRPLTLVVGTAWAGLAFVILLADFAPPLPVVLAFAIASLYFALVGAVQQLTR